MVARPHQVLYIFRCKSCEFHISLRDFWSRSTYEGTGQLLHASRGSLEGVREAEQTQAGCLAHACCDCELNLWHKHHKVNLWMTISNKWSFFQGYPGCCCSTYVPGCLEFPYQMTKKRAVLGDASKMSVTVGPVGMWQYKQDIWALGNGWEFLKCYWQMLLKRHTCFFMKGCLIF